MCLIVKKKKWRFCVTDPSLRSQSCRRQHTPTFSYSAIIALGPRVRKKGSGPGGMRSGWFQAGNSRKLSTSTPSTMGTVYRIYIQYATFYFTLYEAYTSKR